MKSKLKLSLAVLASVLGGVVAVPAGTITNDMVVHLPFDNGYDNLAPSTVVASPVNTVTFGSGKIGAGAMQFSSDPTNSVFNYVTLGTPAELNFGGSVDLSISLWVKFTRWKGDPSFISNKDWTGGGNAGWVLATAGNGGYQWNFTDGGGRKDYDGPGGTINDGNWHQIAVVYDRDGNATTFLDGAVVDTQSIGPGTETLDSGLPTNIGQDGNGNYTDGGGVGIDDGMIDDVAIWRRALTSFEMQRVYQFGTDGIGVSAIPDPALPTLASTTPPANAVDVRANTEISAVLVDGSSPVDDNSIVLSLDGGPVAASLNKVGNQTTVTYLPPAPLENGRTYSARIVFGDGTALITNDWSFVVVKSSQVRGITGHWEFDGANLAATIGQALEYRGGAAGATALNTRFGTTATFGLPPINGNPATVMQIVPATTSATGYLMNHGARPNGGDSATKVNQWTIIMDMFIPNAGGETWFSFMQIDDPNNSNDGDLFARFGGGVAGIGIGGNYPGALLAGQWHRVAFAVDMADPVASLHKYIDGAKVGEQNPGQLNGRHGLLPTALLFSDEDGESQPAFVNSIQIRNYRMSDAGLAALGGPSSDGIPLVSGQWDFEAGDLVATIGTDLAPRPDTEFVTTYGIGVFDDGAGNIMSFNYPAGGPSTLGYVLPHGILPNGGGEKVNQYTLIMDIQFPPTSTGFRSLFQTETNSTTDGDIFLNGGNGLGISGQYQGDVTADAWHRVAVTVDLTKRELGKYIDGVNVLTGPVGSAPLGTGPYQYLSATDGLVDNRWSLDTIALLFADEDGEIAAGSVNSIQTRPVVLSASEIARLGKATSTGIPAVIPAVPALTITIGDFGLVKVSWSETVTGYILESSPALGAGADWTTVTDVFNNSYEESRVPAPAFFYRLRKE